MRAALLAGIGSVVIIVSLACVGGASPDAPPAPEPVPAPEPALAPEPPAEDSVTAPGLWKPTGEAIGHCTAEQHAIFSCAMKGGKVLSVCGGPADDQLQYSFGKVGSPELVFPESPALEPFLAKEVSYIRSSGTVLKFTKADTTYEVASMSGSGCCSDEEAQMNNFIGVHVAQDEKIIASLTCADPIHDDLLLLRDVPGVRIEADE